MLRNGINVMAYFKAGAIIVQWVSQAYSEKEIWVFLSGVEPKKEALAPTSFL